MDWLTGTRFAHRGLHDNARGIPENSRAAFAAAADAGHGVELDVRLSADGQAVVYHDATLDTLTELTGPVAARTANELARTRLLGTRETIPRLQEVLDLVGGRVPVLVEIKSNGAPVGALEASALAAIESRPDTTAVISFDPRSIRWFRDMAPAVPRGQSIIGLTSTSGGMPPWRRVAVRFTGAVTGCDPDFLVVDLPALTTRGSPLPIIAWTVRTARDRVRAEKRADSYIFEGEIGGVTGT